MIRLRRKSAESAECRGSPPAVFAALTEPLPDFQDVGPATPQEGVAHRRLAARRLPMLVAAAGLAGAGLITSGPRRVDAAYSTGTAPDGGDLVNTHLTVQGNLTVNGNAGIGTSAPRVKLDVNGPVATTLGFVSAFGGTHVGFNTYYAPGWRNLDPANPGIFLRFDQTSGLLYSASTGSDPVVTPRGGWHSYGNTFYQMGQLGVGTASPVEKLDVVGNVRISGTVIVNGAVAIDSNGVAAKSYYAP